MSIKFLHRNNFEKDDDLIIELLEADKKFLQERKSDYLSLKKTLKPNFFMSIKQQYINFAHLIAKNVIVATIIMLIALTTVGASAAELLAPEEFKPSTQIQNLFAANQQKDTNPYTALKPDENNDVVSMDKCNMSIKYPKKVDNITTEYFISGDVNEETSEERPYYYTSTNNGQFSLQSIMIMTYSKQLKNSYNAMTMYCFDKSSLADQDFVQANKNIKNLSKEELRLLTGWFITDAELENIKMLEDVTPSAGPSDSQTTISFSYQNLIYEIVINNGEVFPVSSGNQIQLQFNSLVKNEASVEILDKKPEVVQPEPEVKEEDTDTIEAPGVKEGVVDDIIEPLVADENHEVVVIEECDLAVKYAKNVTVDNQNYTRKIDYSKEKLSLINLNKNVMDEPSGMDITCNQKVMQEEMYDLVSPQKSKEEICNILNLTEASCNEIQGLEEYLMTKNYTPNRGILFKFKFDNKEYRILLGYVNPEKQGLENIQIQFNSLAPSTASLNTASFKLTEHETLQNTSDRI